MSAGEEKCRRPSFSHGGGALRGAHVAPAAGTTTSSGAGELQPDDHVRRTAEPLAGGAAGRGEEGSKDGAPPEGTAGPPPQGMAPPDRPHPTHKGNQGG